MPLPGVPVYPNHIMYFPEEELYNTHCPRELAPEHTEVLKFLVEVVTECFWNVQCARSVEL
jgi:hypothetical protein